MAQFVAQGGFTKPLITYVAGRFTESMPEGTIFGHAGAMIEGGKGKPLTKVKVLRDAGVHVVDRYDDIITVLQSLNLKDARAHAARPNA